MTFELLKQKAIQEREALANSDKPRVYIGTGTCGQAAGSYKVLEHIKAVLDQKKIDAAVIEVGCLGLCYIEPLIYIAKKNQPVICYGQVAPELAEELITDYIIQDNPRPDLAVCTLGKGRADGIPEINELPVFQSQIRIALRNSGLIDPGNINHYLAADGYFGLEKALKMSPEAVIEEVGKAGLRGRGGAGFSTANKWRTCSTASGNEKYLICNAHEGDPGAFITRALLESDPHTVLEGMLIGAYAAGASSGYIYIRSDYVLAIARLKMALKQMVDCGLLGQNILGSDFSFKVQIIEAPVDFVCGEETALLRTLEGQRGMPFPRPPFPAVSGLRDKPTIINNVETLADAAVILNKGAAWFAGYGTENSKGTKIFTLTGKIARSGLIEVPMGTSLRRIIYDIGGGIPGGKEFKAALVGGPSGGWLPAGELDLPVDYENLNSAGVVMGSGSIIVADSDSCMVDLARWCSAFINSESCGECVMCREGTYQFKEITQDMTEGKSKIEEIGLLEELGEGMQMESLCGLGKTAPNSFLTAVKHFRGEFETHIKEKRCPARVCTKLNS